MADYFFDTGALVKRHVDEAGSPWVRSLVRAKAGHTLYIARITTVEITSAITRRQYWFLRTVISMPLLRSKGC
jgi:hypothetical protein